MGIRQTQVTITIDRETKRGEVSGDTLSVRDKGVQLSLVNVSQEEVDGGLVFQLWNGYDLIAQCSTWNKATVVDGVSTVTGTLSTNTSQAVALFTGCPYMACRTVMYKLFSTANSMLLPIVFDVIKIVNFPAESAEEPEILSTPAELIAKLTDLVDSAIAKSSAVSDSLANYATIVSLQSAVSDLQVADASKCDKSAVVNFRSELKNSLSVIPTTDKTTLAQLRERFNALVVALNNALNNLPE